jgi:butyrate kinase
MDAKTKVLVINPGSTSTKIAVFHGSDSILEHIIDHPVEELRAFKRVTDQYETRKRRILEVLAASGVEIETFHAVVGRGGLIYPVSGGTYTINDRMLADLRTGVMGDHASNLGGIIAHEIAREYRIPSYIVDPVVVDEMARPARYSGVPGIERSSIFHALNQKAVARLSAERRSGSYESFHFIVVHLGGGITVGAHAQGRVIDVNDGLNGEGPFTPERSGGLPALKLVKRCFSGQFTQEEITRQIKGDGGFAGYLGTNDGREVARRVEEGDEEARSVFEAMAYQVAKEVGAMATVLKGRVDAILITGGLAHNSTFTRLIEERVGFIAPVELYPGEHEMIALALGAVRVLTGEEEALVYRGQEQSR